MASGKGKKKPKYDKSVVDIRPAEEVLGPELIEKIAEKEWKVAELPSEEELAKEKHKSPKARSNPNSRKNLIQYQKDKSKEVKEKVIKSQKRRVRREKINPFDYIDLPDGYDKKKISAFLPDKRVLKNAEEEKSFYIILNSYFHDFDLTELTSSDIEDIISLAVNRIIENRLLEVSSKDPAFLMDISSTVEKFRRHSEKVKAGLASRRSDRIDPRDKQSFSIADLVIMYDEKKKREFRDRIEALDGELSDYSERLRKE